MATKQNRQNPFEAADEEREQSQRQLEEKLTARKNKRIQTTVHLDQDAATALKKYAADMRTTSSDIVNLWIRKHCSKYLE